MQRVYNFSVSKKENELIESMIREELAICSDDDANIRSFTNVDDFLESISDALNINISCIDVVANKGIEAAEVVRRENSQANVIVIADLNLSPVSYLKPSIMASALFLRPINCDNIRDSLHQIIVNLTAASKKEKAAGSFVLKTQGKSEYIDFDKIYYFEAREKHVYVSTKRNEYGFYSTLDKIEKDLPANFARCHRGFIINMDKVERIEFSQNAIFLYDNICVPLSRSYKSKIKNII